MKENRYLKWFSVINGENRTDLQNAIVDVIKDKYANETAGYDLVENIADNQNKFYIISQTNGSSL